MNYYILKQIQVIFFSTIFKQNHCYKSDKVFKSGKVNFVEDSF